VKNNPAWKPTTDGIEIIDRVFFEGRPERIAAYEETSADCDVGRAIRELRTKAKISQRELAKRVGTTASVICRLEDADYEGHSFAMLRRVADAVGKQVVLRFVPRRGPRRAPHRPM